ncbi:helix-turn-helix domain-containing protein [Lacticaseibacillus songhuajiangensis]|uniref:helix-turn-helix domain-containing protein n=1 Tax=Lacticaseibacillus songhuajiangensis TaxID=1296539 RepID=UPI000F7B1CE5|nr:helix-turn-helix transcriptional regulator [Lacticaseibacillus songhuajiangensis]
MPEQVLQRAAKDVKVSIKNKLNEREISQRQLAEMLGVGETILTNAIRGDVSPQAIRLRTDIYKILGMNEQEV